MGTASWIVGRGGLLGAALARVLRDDEHVSAKIGWNSAEQDADLRRGAASLAGRLRPGMRWQVCWCAGAGVVGSDEHSLAGETAALRQLLEALAAQPELRRTAGTFALSSSAGGVYAGCGDLRICEATVPRPLSAYGHAKLEQERLLGEMAPRFAHLSTLIARFSNLYGPGQRLEKPQGLISHVARAVIEGQPVRIYVPLDTMRDYLFVDDAASMLAAGLQRVARERDRLRLSKIYASERDTSIASLLNIFRHIAKRRLRVISGLHATTSQQPRRLSFRSTVWPEDRQCARTDLLAGIGIVFHRQLRAYTARSSAT